MKKENHKTLLGLEPWTIGALGKCATTASYPPPLLSYMLL